MTTEGGSGISQRWVLPFLGLACAVGVGSIYYNQPLLLVMGKSLGLTPHVMGFVATATQVGYAAGLLCIVPLGDIAERRGLMMKLYAAVSVALLFTAFAKSLAWIVTASILVGLFASVTHIALPIAPDLVPKEKRGAAIGTVMTGLLLGVLLARTFAGWLSDWRGWRLVFVVAAVMNLAFVPLLAKMMPKLPPKQSLSYGETLRSLGTIFRQQPLLREAGLLGMLSFASFSCFWTTMAFMLDKHFHLGAGVAGSFGIVGAAGATVAPFAGKLSDKKGTRYVVTVAISIFIAALLMLWGSDYVHTSVALHLVMLVVGVLILDMGQQMLQVGNQTRIFGLGAEARSRVNTVYMTMYFIGGAAGSLLSTIAWGKWEWDGVCVLQLGLIGLGLLAHLTGYSRKHPHQDPHLSAEDREMLEM
ncbi:MFS transporter [Granulicella cerasi]|uniref:MFS transporter n=1 Tax=Granulicella cerasi TaxID=741063 RepID=A0ABW1ZGK0_9BACT|nr:MFS transporter [Granulicella cerasi]